MNASSDLSQLVVKHFSPTGGDLVFLRGWQGQREELERRLSKRIAEMLDHEMEKLVNAMYRIDVSEPAFSEALNHSDRAERIARLVVERLLQKVESRKRWRQHQAEEEGRGGDTE
jgi:tRNA A37 N6-isopentenylltransferase MiaA